MDYLRNIEDDIYALWAFLWKNEMVGSVTDTDGAGKKRTRYFLNDYGKQVFSIVIQRYQLTGHENLPVGSTGQQARVLIVCPFCGGKTEQGLVHCQKCGASL